MNRHIALPLTAGLLLIFSVVCALDIQRSEPETPPPVPPPVSPFVATVAGAGMVEPSTEASTTGGISVGSQLPGVVTKIGVHIGQTVKPGDLLFELDLLARPRPTWRFGLPPGNWPRSSSAV